MPTNDLADPTVQDADQRAERAKASLLSRVELLKHKLTDARNKLDLPAQITKHPLPAIGVAFALGVLAGLRRTTPAALGGSTARPFRNAAVAALTAFGLRLVRNVALGQLAEVAKQWWSEHDEPSEHPATPAHGSRAAGVAPPLEH